ncbi:unnamed protein product [Rotaria magnacalcarata]|uniref:Uncharacterized protein n=1 Tax=Rotaria magnacalcarata TaxID=392030 RepID=A0A816S1K6_9BILA|nr:unnamed protein product [Rotaria magnacalcarata]
MPGDNDLPTGTNRVADTPNNGQSTPNPQACQAEKDKYDIILETHNKIADALFMTTSIFSSFISAGFFVTGTKLRVQEALFTCLCLFIASLVFALISVIVQYFNLKKPGNSSGNGLINCVVIGPFIVLFLSMATLFTGFSVFLFHVACTQIDGTLLANCQAGASIVTAIISGVLISFFVIFICARKNCQVQ